MFALSISNLGWDDFMRTTIDIDDQLLLYAKHQAVEQGCTIKQIMEDALRDFFSHQTLEQDLKRLDEALFSFDRDIALMPDYIDKYFIRSITLCSIF